jgi:transcriptional regulator with XRE-family HTH domain
MAGTKLDIAAPAVPAVMAANLRRRRVEADMSVRALARSVGVSPSLVSQIELGKANPSVGTLYAIVTELGLSLDQLFADPGEQHAGADPEGDQEGVVLRRDDRASLELGAGVRWERLSPTIDPDVDFLHVTYEPGGASCPPGTFMRHAGREYGLVLSGTLGAAVGAERYELCPGDSIVLDSTTPHRFWTVGDEPSSVVWTVIGRADDGRLP